MNMPANPKGRVLAIASQQSRGFSPAAAIEVGRATSERHNGTAATGHEHADAFATRAPVAAAVALHHQPSSGLVFNRRGHPGWDTFQSAQPGHFSTGIDNGSQGTGCSPERTPFRAAGTPVGWLLPRARRPHRRSRRGWQ